MTAFKPLHDRILIERLDHEDQTPGGIIIPDSAKEKPQRGKVLATGKGKVAEDGRLTPIELKPGDIVLFGKYAGTEIKIDNQDRLIMREEDVLAVIEDSENLIPQAH